MTDAPPLVPTDRRWFEDYHPGAIYTFGPVRFEEAEIIEFARRFDPQTMHTDPEAAAAGPTKGLIASGWHTVSAVAGVFIREYLSRVASLPSPGVDEIRWLKPVRPGDALMVRVTTLETRPSRSKPDRGLLYSLVEGIDAEGQPVVTMKAMNLTLKRPAPAAAVE